MTGITEYNWGAEKHISGATSQADILGIFGRGGIDVANRWTAPDSGTPAYSAIRMSRNYAGRKLAFGDVSVQAAAPDPDALSAFAATRTSDGALTVMLVSKALSGDYQRLESHADRSRAGLATDVAERDHATQRRIVDLLEHFHRRAVTEHHPVGVPIG
jgi:hypothetical protein